MARGRKRRLLAKLSATDRAQLVIAAYDAGRARQMRLPRLPL
jgi:hypothetical protein